MYRDADIKAVIATIRKCEGTDAADGYSYLFGSTPNNNRRFTDFSKHPNQRFPFICNGETQYSSAAGALQILKGTYDTLCRKYGFAAFAPEDQDIMGLALFDTRNVLKAVADGKFLHPDVLDTLNNEWASLPGAEYGQPTKTLDKITKWYLAAGGVIAK